MAKGYLEVEQNGLAFAARKTLPVTNVRNENGKADILRFGEWVIEASDGSGLKRPDDSAGAGADKLNAVGNNPVRPLIAAEGRTDVSSGYKASVLTARGAICRTNMIPQTVRTNLVGASGAELTGAGDGVANPETFTDAATDFEAAGVKSGDTLVIASGGAHAGTYTIVGVSGTVLTLSALDEDVLSGGAVTDVADTANYYIEGGRPLDFGTYKSAKVALFQPADDPSTLVAGLVPDGQTTYQTGAADGTTPDLIVDDSGPVVATVLRPPYVPSGLGREKGDYAIDFILK
jgi:hypothetical protein